MRKKYFSCHVLNKEPFEYWTSLVIGSQLYSQIGQNEAILKCYILQKENSTAGIQIMDELGIQMVKMCPDHQIYVTMRVFMRGNYYATWKSVKVVCFVFMAQKFTNKP